MSGFHQVRRAAQPHILALLRLWLPKGKLSGREYKALNPKRADHSTGSFSINIDTGVWADFAVGGAKGGDIVRLAEYLFDEDTAAACSRIEKTVKGNGAAKVKPAKKPEPVKATVWTGAEPPLVQFAMRNMPLPAGAWFYRDAKGAIIAAVARYNMPDGSKEFRPWICTKVDSSFGGNGLAWRSKAPSEPRPLYNLHKLNGAANGAGSSRVIVTEGEKKADAAMLLFSCAAVSPMNGARSPGKSDWSVLKGYEVIVWPDHDQPGIGFAEEVARLANEAGAASVRIVQVPDSFPKKWDLADAPPPGADLKALLEGAEGWERSIGGDLSHSDLALGFVERHKDELRYVALWGKWIMRCPHGWEEDEKLKVFGLSHAFAADVAVNEPKRTARVIKSAPTCAAILTMARSEDIIAASTKQWDADLRAFNTPDGIVDLETGALRIRRPEDYVLKCAAVSPSAKEDCPAWFRFLNRVIPDKAVQKYLQRAVGYSLTGLTTEHTLFFLYGTGRNGKGTFINTVFGMLGNYARSTAVETFMASRNERHSQELAVLDGARYVIAQEPEEGRGWNEARIKSLTGGDPITAHFMRQNDFTFMPQLKLWIAGNHKPSLRSVDPAMRSRLHLLPFTVFIPREERNLDLSEELKEEWPGILRWALDGCLEWQRTGLAPPPGIVDATEEYFRNEDTFTLWLEEKCVVAGQVEHPGERPLPKDVFTPTAELYHSWRSWADMGGYFIGSEKQFTGKMAAFEGARVGKPQVRGFLGIRLRKAKYE